MKRPHQSNDVAAIAFILADLLGVPVRRATVQETTALGAAYLAGIAEGVWDTPAEAAASWTADASFTRAMAADERDARVARWHRAVERSRAWESADSEAAD